MEEISLPYANNATKINRHFNPRPYPKVVKK
jgi:hypothetical protein